MKKFEVTYEKAILRYEPLMVPHELLIFNTCECLPAYVGAINSTKTLVEIPQVNVIQYY